MKTLDEMIAVMHASKTYPIQFIRKDGLSRDWMDCYPVPDGCSHPFDWSTFDYRVKPEKKKPHTIRCKHHADGSFTVTASWDLRDGVVEFIELTPEVKAKLGL